MHQQIRQVLFQRLVVQPSVTIPPVLRYLEVTVFAVGCTDTLCTVVRFILAVAEGERPCGEFVLVCGCFTPDDTAPKVGKGNAGGKVHLLGIGSPCIHQRQKCGFIIGIAFRMTFSGLF